MKKIRLEIFTDGVIAIIITIMVLKLRIPNGSELAALLPLLPTFLSYVLSFFFLSLYWISHHHMLHAVDTVNGRVLWANLNFLFWLSLIPFATGFMGENHFAAIPLAFYGSVMFMAGLSFYVLERTLISANGDQSILAKAVGKDIRSLLSPALWLVGIGLSLYVGAAAVVVYIVIALMWIMPNRRIEGMAIENRDSPK
ncbi:MAG: TMEM175 family protein [Betaproteobacteria bacterium]